MLFLSIYNFCTGGLTTPEQFVKRASVLAALWLAASLLLPVAGAVNSYANFTFLSPHKLLPSYPPYPSYAQASSVTTIVMEGTFLLPSGYFASGFRCSFLSIPTALLNTLHYTIPLHNSISETSSKLYHSNNIFSSSAWVRGPATRTDRETIALQARSLSLVRSHILVQLLESPRTRLALSVLRLLKTSRHQRISKGCSVNLPLPLPLSLPRRRLDLQRCRPMISSPKSRLRLRI